MRENISLLQHRIVPALLLAGGSLLCAAGAGWLLMSRRLGPGSGQQVFFRLCRGGHEAASECVAFSGSTGLLLAGAGLTAGLLLTMAGLRAWKRGCNG